MYISVPKPLPENAITERGTQIQNFSTNTHEYLPSLNAFLQKTPNISFQRLLSLLSIIIDSTSGA